MHFICCVAIIITVVVRYHHCCVVVLFLLLLMFIYANHLHADKCLLPYYGGCSYTRQCNSFDLGANCSDCLPGYFEAEPMRTDCICKLFIRSELKHS